MCIRDRTTGGRALKFYSSIRLEVRKGESLKQGSEFVGSRTKVKVVKNKVAPPFKTAEFDIMFGEGISREGDVLDLAAACNVVNKSGAWYAYNGEKIGQGRENAKIYLKEHPEVFQEIDHKVRVFHHLLEEEPVGTEAVSYTHLMKTRIRVLSLKSRIPVFCQLQGESSRE